MEVSYCVFNDVAVAAQYLLDRGLAGRILIVDLDVHKVMVTQIFLLIIKMFYFQYAFKIKLSS